MVRLSFCLLPFTMSIYLFSAGQSAETTSARGFGTWEAQLGGSITEYFTRNSTGPGGTTPFSSKGPRLAPSLRVSLDPITHPYGSIAFSAGYKFANDVLLEYDLSGSKHDAYSDLKHKSQLMIGTLLKFDFKGNFRLGVGFDARYDWMRSEGRVGSASQDNGWRPWARAVATYHFDIGAYTTPFIGIEFAQALSRPSVTSANHYRDYVINTGDIPLGGIDTSTNSQQSFTRGHFPAWELTISGGIRFGRPGKSARKAKASKVPDVVQPTVLETKPEVDDPLPLTPEERLTRDGFSTLIINFGPGSSALSEEDQNSIDRWVEDIWHGLGYSSIIQTSQLCIIGNNDQRHELPTRQLADARANALERYLWDKHRINVSKVQGFGSDRPLATGFSNEAHIRNRYAMLMLDGSDPRNSEYKNNIRTGDRPLPADDTKTTP
jgi:outer membrane protein OmpA-like peptidoglycan-associated protein/opacity protein-like surface antigen